MIKINKYFYPYIILIIILGLNGKLLLAFFVAFFHELIHYAAAYHYGFKGECIEFLPVGTLLHLKDLDEASIKEDIIIALSGPIANIAFAVIFYVINKFISGSIIYKLYELNLTIGLFNLLPTFPLDGGRVLRNLINIKAPYRKANSYTMNLSILIGFFIMLFSIFLFLKGINNYFFPLLSLLIIGSSLREKERIAYVIMGNVIKKKNKFMKNGYMECKVISVYYKLTLVEVLSLVDKNKCNIFNVLDDDMLLIDNIYEGEIIEALKFYGNISLEEFIDTK